MTDRPSSPASSSEELHGAEQLATQLLGLLQRALRLKQEEQVLKGLLIDRRGLGHGGLRFD